MASEAAWPATLRDGRYAVIGLLGEGSQAQTLDAVDKRDGRAVAIKRFVVRGAHSWKDVELAEREARVLSTLRHPGLPGYIEHFEENGDLYLVLEKIDGESLLALRRRGGRLTRTEVTRFLRELGQVLAYLHGLSPPVIHRDIKPGNVIRRPDGSFALVDFGSVRDRLKPEGGSTVVGTFGYMAPEQFQGRALPQSDVYAVAATAISLISGQEPENLPHQGLKIDVGRVIGHDPELAELFGHLLEPDPDQRPASLAAMLNEREELGEEPAQPPRGEGRRRRAGRRDEAQRARRARRARRPQERGPLPPIVFALFMLGLVMARVAVRFAVGIVVPLLLTMLSVLFGRGLRVAARNVRYASFSADRALGRAMQVVRRVEVAQAAATTPAAASASASASASPSPSRPAARAARPRVRVEPEPARRERVVDTTGDEVDADYEELAEESASRRERLR